MMPKKATRQVYKGILANTISVEKSNAAKDAQDAIIYMDNCRSRQYNFLREQNAYTP